MNRAFDYPHSISDRPEVSLDGVSIRVIMGSAFELSAQLRPFSSTVLPSGSFR